MITFTKKNLQHIVELACTSAPQRTYMACISMSDGHYVQFAGDREVCIVEISALVHHTLDQLVVIEEFGFAKNGDPGDFGNWQRPFECDGAFSAEQIEYITSLICNAITRIYGIGEGRGLSILQGYMETAPEAKKSRVRAKRARSGFKSDAPAVPDDPRANPVLAFMWKSV